MGPDMGPLDRGGLIQNKPFYSQPVFLVVVLRVSYSLSLICLMTSEDIKHKILSGDSVAELSGGTGRQWRGAVGRHWGQCSGAVRH